MAVNKELVKDNLYLAVNGAWLETAEIPSDKPATSAFQELDTELEAFLMEKMEAWSLTRQKFDDQEMNEMVSLYRQAADFDRRDSDQARPLEPYLASISQVQSFANLQSLLKDLVYQGFDLPFSMGVSADLKNADIYSLYVSPAPLILPDKTYYGTEQGEALLAVYRDMAVQLVDLAGLAEGDRLVAEALEVDALLAPHQKTSEEKADIAGLYNPRSMDQLGEMSQTLDLAGLIRDLVSDQVEEVIMDQPEYFDHFEETIQTIGLDRLKSWLLVRAVVGTSSYLSEDMRQLASVYGRTLSGTAEAPSQAKHAYHIAYNQFDQVLGVYYGKNYFGPAAKADVEHMVREMIAVYKDRLAKNSWLSQETIDQAIVKLDHMDVLVGYPEEWPELYAKFAVDPAASLLDNLLQMNEVAVKDNLAKWNRPVDRSLWGMSAATVNAYFSPTNNQICFPAAILQEPFYSKDRPTPANYGGIGAVMAHEISHAFDNNGARFDETGSLNNWWTEEDFAVFEDKQKEVIDQWEGLETPAGPVNGTLTVSENIADLGGLTCALQAAKKEADFDPETFFYSWARIWAIKASDEYYQLLLSVDVHAPASLRANISPQNLAEFYETFDVKEGDGMYLAPADRIVIW